MTLRWARTSVRSAATPDEGRPVSTLELFFDLVFVFTITQITALVRDGAEPTGYLRGAAVLVVTWWIYDGYAWLSNNIEPTTLSTRLPMLVGMAGFLFMAIATPEAFGSQAWAFAVAYLLVVLVHSAQFTRSSLGTSSKAIRRIVPVNVTTALMLVLAAALSDDLAWIGWALAIVPLVFAVVVRRERGFAVRPGHFAERHQLIIIIALGETVVAVGAGAQDRLHSFPVVVAVLLSLALLSAVWWLYFGGDDGRTCPASRRNDRRRSTPWERPDRSERAGGPNLKPVRQPQHVLAGGGQRALAQIAYSRQDPFAIGGRRGDHVAAAFGQRDQVVYGHPLLVLVPADLGH
jgi:low temperature requirement protein LtrA